jgi:hypothetical protein
MTIGAGDSMGEFEDCYHRYSDFVVTRLVTDSLQQFMGVFALTLGGDCRSRVEHQSHCGGSKASR